MRDLGVAAHSSGMEAPSPALPCPLASGTSACPVLCSHQSPGRQSCVLRRAPQGNMGPMALSAAPETGLPFSCAALVLI